MGDHVTGRCETCESASTCTCASAFSHEYTYNTSTLHRKHHTLCIIYYEWTRIEYEICDSYCPDDDEGRFENVLFQLLEQWDYNYT